ncbi:MULTISPECIES: 3-deoxy-manno-octulosonate cytidylyltransferase [Calditerrivibrio]|jgi:3-deoxy-manno-octulosonate cytidylyltransferase (CMP-KDO synthetase)|uniref:3-deoxy-manno-octulosonate cytidylyltransferase n=1 Tax=Calditerrivibrio TaxID=545865 RepID=UPI003C73FE21
MSVAVVIPARYASTRLEGKPLKEIAGVPMIAWVAQNCKKSKANRVIVVTDDARILDECKKIDGIEATMSDPSLPSGTDRVAKVARYLDDDIIINVQGDEPFIDYKVIDMLIDDLNNSDAVMNTACVKIDETTAQNPNVVKVVFDKTGYALYFSRSPIPYYRDKEAQKFFYKHIGIYGYRKNFLKIFTSLEPSVNENIEKLEQLRALDNGYKIKVIETEYNGISVDTEEDLIKANKYAMEILNG